MSNETSNSLINIPELPPSVDNAVKNLTDTPTKNIGQTFGDVWYLVFGGISHAADKKRMRYSVDLEKYHQELTTAINEIPEEKKIEPSIQVTAQALENSKYCVSSDELRKMFVNLISGTMNRDIANDVHPSFPEIIKQMSENDAKVLKYLKSNLYVPVANIDCGYGRASNVCSIDELELSTQQLSQSIESLKRFGLVRITYSEHLKDENAYLPIKSLSIYKSSEELSKLWDTSIRFTKGVCDLTHIGNLFISVCVS